MGQSSLAEMHDTIQHSPCSHDCYGSSAQDNQEPNARYFCRYHMGTPLKDRGHRLNDLRQLVPKSLVRHSWSFLCGVERQSCPCHTHMLDRMPFGNFWGMSRWNLDDHPSNAHTNSMVPPSNCVEITISPNVPVPSSLLLPQTKSYSEPSLL